MTIKMMVLMISSVYLVSRKLERAIHATCFTIGCGIGENLHVAVGCGRVEHTKFFSAFQLFVYLGHTKDRP